MDENRPDSLVALQQLADMSAWVHTAYPVGEMLSQAVEKLCLALGAQWGVISLRSSTGAAVSYRAGKLPEQAADGAWETLTSWGLADLVMRGNQSMRLSKEDLSTHPLALSLPEALRAQMGGWMSVPLLRRNGRNTGIVQLWAPANRSFEPIELSLLQQSVGMLALAVENDRLSGSEQQARQAAETLRVANLALTHELNLVDVLETLLDYLGWIVPYDTASVLLLEGTLTVSVRAYRSYDPQTGESRQPSVSSMRIRPNSVLHSVLVGQKSLLIADTRQQPVWEPPMEHANQSWLGVSLVSDGQSIGLCVVEKVETGFFTEDHLRLAEALAAQAVVAIDNARLFDALRRSEERYRSATELASDFAYAFRVEEDGALGRDWVTEAFKRITGFNPGDIDTRQGWAALAHPDDKQVAKEHLDTLLGGKGHSADFRIMTKKGEVRWLRDNSRPVLDQTTKKILRIDGAAQDITERKLRERELEAVATVASALRTLGTQSEMLPVVLEQSVKLLNAEGAAIGLRDPASQEIEIAIGRGKWAEWHGLRLAAAEGISGFVVASGKPYRTDDALKDPQRSRTEQVGDLISVVCVPLIARDETIGALWAGRRLPIQESEVRLLTAVSDIAANAIRRAALHEQTERRLQNLTALRSIDRAISSSLDLNLTLDILLNHVVSQLGAHAADILIFDSVSQMLEYRAGKGFRSLAATHTRLRLGEGLAGKAAQERRLIQFNGSHPDDPDFSSFPLLVGEGFHSYGCAPLISKGQVKGVLEVFHRSRMAMDLEWMDLFDTLAGQAAIAVESAQLFDSLQQSNFKLMMAYDATIEGWSRALELRDKETEGHSKRVTEMTVRLARAVGMSEEEMIHVRRGALLHDIGKMGIPDNILLKEGPLSDEERSVMRLHPRYAYDMLLPIGYLRQALDIPYCHHEKWNGQGYPRGLKGEEIPLSARIFAIADVWDALRSNRPYGDAWPLEKAREYIRSQAGEYFDPKVVEVFFNLGLGA